MNPFRNRQFYDLGTHFSGRIFEIDEFARLSGFIQRLLKIKERTLAFAANGKAGVKAELSELLHNGDSGSAQVVLDQWQQQLMEQFEKNLQRESDLLDIEAGAVAQAFMRQESVDVENPHSAESGESGFAGLFTAMAQNGLKLEVTEELAKEGIVAVLKQGKNLLPSLFKGIGPKTMGKWATKSAPLIGPAIDVVMAVYDYYKANEIERRQIRQQQQHHEKITQKVNGLVDNIYEQLEQILDDSLDDIFAPLIKQLEDRLEQGSQETQGVEADVAALKALQVRSDDF